MIKRARKERKRKPQGTRQDERKRTGTRQDQETNQSEEKGGEIESGF
jgi:hypothetical protein